jgi:hypothetical protein
MEDSHATPVALCAAVNEKMAGFDQKAECLVTSPYLKSAPLLTEGYDPESEEVIVGMEEGRPTLRLRAPKLTALSVWQWRAEAARVRVVGSLETDGGVFPGFERLEEVCLEESLLAALPCDGYRGYFENCPSLHKVSLPDSMKEFGARLFAGCIALKCVSLGGGVTVIGDEAFRGSGLQKLDMQGILRIGREAFANTPLTEAVVPDSVVELGQGHFGVVKSFVVAVCRRR